MAAKPHVTNNAKRQAEWRARQKAAGLVSVTMLVPRQAVGDVKRLGERLAADQDLAVGPVRRISSGKLERL